MAGPVCPVERRPPDPDCSPRPVEGVVVKAIDGAGAVQARAVSDADGGFSFELAPGSYEVLAEPAPHLLGEPAPVEVTVGSEPVDVGFLMYDTGIR